MPRSAAAIPFRPPLAWESLLSYLRLRAIPGVEAVDATHYRRTAVIDGRSGWFGVSMAAGGDALEVEASPSLSPVIEAVLARVRLQFDLASSPDAVSASLSQDAGLRDIVCRLPGLRVPGAFDGFELGVRAILGQQVSVKAATTIAGRWARAFGEVLATPHAGLDRATPTAERLAGVAADDIASLGIVGSRARSIAALARAVRDGELTLTGTALGEAQIHEQIQALLRLPGIGPWTAQYIAMRALKWPDAFPGTDLMLLRAAGAGHKELLLRAERWRPWRAYATHYLWQSLVMA